jgi:hypothetical protein
MMKTCTGSGFLNQYQGRYYRWGNFCQFPFDIDADNADNYYCDYYSFM